jgi:hypothetical protein
MSDPVSGPGLQRLPGTAPDWQYGPPGLAPGYAHPGAGSGRHAPQRRGRRSHGPRIAAAVLAVAVVAGGSVVAYLRLSPADHQAGQAASSSAPPQPPAITKAQAEQVLSYYTKITNDIGGDLRLSSSLLGTIEGGSSYTEDAGNNTVWMFGYPGTRFPPLEPVHVVYYIPDQSAHASFPHWFLVQFTDADTATVPHGLATETTSTGYLVFSQASVGAPWLDVSEPSLISGAAPAPQIATDSRGYAIAVSPGADAAGLRLAPGQAGPVTAAGLNDLATSAITAPSNLGNLIDENQVATWQGDVGTGFPAGTTVSIVHQAGPGPVFGLRTTGGGAIVFYYLNAQVSIVAPAGSSFRLNAPGFGTSASSAQVPFVDQFAAFDPPKGHAVPRVIADSSGWAKQG